MHSENFKADFLKMASTHMQPSETRHIHVFGSRNVT